MVEACSGVFDAEGCAICFGGHGDADAAAIGLHVHGIGDEVAQRLTQLDWIAGEGLCAL